MLQEAHALFNRRLTVEAGFTYSRSSRALITLSGFLALDAIFLGRISVDEVEADILRFDLTGRYGLTDRLQVDINAPFFTTIRPSPRAASAAHRPGLARRT